MNNQKENRLESLADAAYRKILKTFYLIEIFSNRTRHGDVDENYDGITKIKNEFLSDGIEYDNWTYLEYDISKFYDTVKKSFCRRGYSAGAFIVRIRIVKSVNTVACKEGDVIVLESHLLSPEAFDDNGDLLFIDQLGLEPISEFERKFRLEEERENLGKKLEEIKKEMKVHQEKFETLKAHYDSLEKKL